MNKKPLSPLPPLPSSSRRRPVVACACGCGGDTQRRFVPGHDSRLRGWMLRVERGILTLADVASQGSLGEAEAVARELGLDFTAEVLGPEQMGKLG